MRNRYIDFVPINHAPKSPVHSSAPVTVTVQQKTVQIATTQEVVEDFLDEPIAAPEELFEPSADTFSQKAVPNLGVVEDYKPINATRKTIFTNTNVAKRPLFAPRPTPKAPDLNAIKSEKISRKPINLKKTPKTAVAPQDFVKFETPKNPFINTMVEKRPLSKNVYKPNIIPTKEENSSPVRIIETPKKESKAGLVITIILTIILGAAVGTVAFLLLPR